MKTLNSLKLKIILKLLYYVYKKFKKIYLELLEHPTTGTGHPEALKGRDGITYSRHLTAHDRILYNIYEEKIIVVILEVGGHYNDK